MVADRSVNNGDIREVAANADGLDAEQLIQAVARTRQRRAPVTTTGLSAFWANANLQEVGRGEGVGSCFREYDVL